MWVEKSRFDAVIIAGIAGVLGTAYVVGAMIALLSDGGSSAVLLGDSIPVSTVDGVLLLLAGGALAANQRSGRYLGILGFAPVVVFGYPGIASLAPVATFQTALAAVSVLYLLLKNPVVPRTTRSDVDESTSASKVGSTMR